MLRNHSSSRGPEENLVDCLKIIQKCYGLSAVGIAPYKWQSKKYVLQLKLGALEQIELPSYEFIEDSDSLAEEIVVDGLGQSLIKLERCCQLTDKAQETLIDHQINWGLFRVIKLSRDNKVCVIFLADRELKIPDEVFKTLSFYLDIEILNSSVSQLKANLEVVNELSRRSQQLIDFSNILHSLPVILNKLIDFDLCFSVSASPDPVVEKLFPTKTDKIVSEWTSLSLLKVYQDSLKAKIRKNSNGDLTFFEEFKSVMVLPLAIKEHYSDLFICSRKPYYYSNEDLTSARILISHVLSIDATYQALSSMRGYTENVIQTMNSGVIAVDSNRGIELINPEMLRILDISEPSDSFKNIDFHKMLESYPEILNLFSTAVEQGIPMLEPTYCFSSRLNKHLAISCFHLKDQDGLVTGNCLIVRDISTEKRLEELLRRSEKLSAIGELAAGIAHEVRNPLTGMRMTAQLLESSLGKGDTRVEYTEVIIQEIDRLNRLVGNLLNFAKPRRATFRNIRIDEVINKALLLINKKAEQLGVTISLNFDSGIQKVELDEDRMMQLLINILKNAIDAVENLSVREISIRTGGNAEEVMIEISDTGTGIPPENIDQVFNPFFSTKDTGTGLGLPTAFRVTEEHRGEMEIFNRPSGGVTVRIILPVTH